MQRIVLIGSNIAHSRSPRLHNRLFEHYALPYRYELMPLDPEEVVPALEMMKRGGYRGANVTSPHKLIVMPALDALSEEAEEIGAVNTIVIEEGRAIGYNTDGYGFARSLRGIGIVDAPFSAAIIGTGGAARAALWALLRMEHLREVVLYSRDAATGASVAGRWNDRRVTGAHLRALAPADIVINATPVGLAGSPGMPIDPLLLRGSRLLYEMIYSPSVTPLMRAAREAGLDTVNGEAMFIGQALRSFTLWTGVEDVDDEMLNDEL